MLRTTLLLTIFILSMMAQSWGFGNTVSKRSKFFESNSFLRYSTGAVLYIVSTFVFFLPFLWVPNMNNIYWAIVFGSKEIMIYLFLIGNQSILPRKVNPLKIFAVMVTMIGLVYIDNFVSDIYEVWKKPTYGNFQSWKEVTIALQVITSGSVDVIEKWGLSFFSSLLMTTTVFGIIQSISRKNNKYDLLFAMVMTITIGIIGVNGYSLSNRLHHSIVLLTTVFATNVISKSRRRYSVMMGISFIAAWSQHDNVLFTFIAIGIVTSITYTYINKLTPTSFMMNMFTPIIMISTLYIYTYSLWLALTILIITAIVYTYTTINAELNIVVWAGELISLLGKIFPYVLGITLFIVGVSRNAGQITIDDPSMANHLINLELKNDVVKWINISFFIAISLYGIYFYVNRFILDRLIKDESVNERHMFAAISLISLFLFYNPISYNVFRNTLIDGYMNSLKYFVTIPLMIISTNYIKETRKKHTKLYA